jgi:D-sedoheptulose 7-phosphate isomerase
MKGYLLPRPVPDEVREELVNLFPEEGSYLADHLQGALPTLSLVSQMALITAYANDVAADMIFAQQVYGYGQPGDTLIGISTSGNSRNVLHALRVARARGLQSIGITGKSGGEMARLCDVALRVPREQTTDIQERHLAIYHALCAMLEEEFFRS